LTDQGRDVLSGRLDWLVLHPQDRWRGGVHLNGTEPIWRWDSSRQGFVRGDNY
jgi:hypothetical protein